MPVSHIVNVVDYGASGNGVNDDYQPILEACRYINTRGGGTLYFPKGTYRINRHRVAHAIGQYDISNFDFENCDGLTIEGNDSVLDMDGDWVREASYVNSGNQLSYSLHDAIGIRLTNCSRVTIRNITLDGNCDKTVKDAQAEGPSHGISIYGGNYINIENVHIHHYHADGLMLRDYSSNPGRKQSKNLQVTNSHFSNNARQGCTISQLRHAVFTNCSFNETGNTGLYGGHSPAAGVDIEPDYSKDLDDLTGDISFINCQFVNNVGFQYVGTGFETTPYPVNFYSCTFSSSKGRSAAVVPATRRTSFYSCSFLEVALRPNYGVHKDSPINVNVYESNFENSSSNETAVLATGEKKPSVQILNCQFRFMGNSSALGRYRIWLRNKNSVFEANKIWVDQREYDGTTSAYDVKFLLQGGLKVRDNHWDTDLAEKGKFFTISYDGSHVSNDIYDAKGGFSPGTSLANNTVSIGPFDIAELRLGNPDSAHIRKSMFFANSAPSGDREYKRGDIVFNSKPKAGGTIGWVCVKGGNPGDWKKFGEIQS